MRLKRLSTMVVVLLGIGPVASADAQGVPPHPPGTVCFTKLFWCWAQPPGQAGSECGCPSSQGWVKGVRG